MKLLVILCLVGITVAGDPLRLVLQSPKLLLDKFNEFTLGQNLNYQGMEKLHRLRLFKKNLELIAAANEAQDEAHFVINKFSAMTKEEKQRSLGINITRIPGGDAPDHKPSDGVLSDGPTELFWTNENAVTHTKNQLYCGSCWTFAAVGSIETRYKIKSGVLRAFAEQEFVDCVDDGSHHDNCMGGWPTMAYQWSQMQGGRLASEQDYPYTNGMKRCRGKQTPNSLVAYYIDGFVNVPGDEESTIEALREGALSVAFEVTDHFQQYGSGIMQDRTCTGQLNHGVTAVGYAPNFMLVKNSWGPEWGESGFVKFKRGVFGCGIFRYASHPTFQATGKKDTNPSDAANTYRPDTDVGPTDDGGDDGGDDGDCQDQSNFCDEEMCDVPLIAEFYCQKTCGMCDGGATKKCAPGTVRCPDGVCRHQHMCR